VTNLMDMRHLDHSACSSLPRSGAACRSDQSRQRGRTAAACVTSSDLHVVASHETGRVSSPRGQKGATPPGVIARCLARTDASRAAVRFPGCAPPAVMRGATNPWTTINTG
jgi:hypothetical protein